MQRKPDQVARGGAAMKMHCSAVPKVNSITIAPISSRVAGALPFGKIVWISVPLLIQLAVNNSVWRFVSAASSVPHEV